MVAVPAWSAREPLGPPSLRYEPFFRFLQPLKNRLVAHMEHAGDATRAADWQPDLWRLINHASGKYHEPVAHEPLALFSWPRLRGDAIELPGGWDAWIRTQAAEGNVIPTPHALYKCGESDPWGPRAQNGGR